VSSCRINGPLSPGAFDILERAAEGEDDVNDENRAAYRELATNGFMIAGHTFARGDESLFRFTPEGWERRRSLLNEPSHAGSA
jgi:hypothetical protein